MIWPSSSILTPSSGCDITCFPKTQAYTAPRAACAVRSKSEALRDDVALNFRGARPDNGKARIAKVALHWIFHTVAVAAKNLQAEIGDGLIGLAGIELEHRRVLPCCCPLRHQPCPPG